MYTLNASGGSAGSDQGSDQGNGQGTGQPEFGFQGYGHQMIL
jgi:hypothetical protein